MTTALASTCAGCGRTGPMRVAQIAGVGQRVVCRDSAMACLELVTSAPGVPARASARLVLPGHASDMEAADERWAATVSEAVFQERVITIARRWGWLYYHTHDSQRSEAGFPDLVLVHAYRGLIVFAELKRQFTKAGRPGLMKPTPKQQEWLDALTMARCCAERVIVALWRPSDLPEIRALLSDGKEAE